MIMSNLEYDFQYFLYPNEPLENLSIKELMERADLARSLDKRNLAEYYYTELLKREPNNEDAQLGLFAVTHNKTHLEIVSVIMDSSFFKEFSIAFTSKYKDELFDWYEDRKREYDEKEEKREKKDKRKEIFGKLFVPGLVVLIILGILGGVFIKQCAETPRINNLAISVSDKQPASSYSCLGIRLTVEFKNNGGTDILYYSGTYTIRNKKTNQEYSARIYQATGANKHSSSKMYVDFDLSNGNLKSISKDVESIYSANIKDLEVTFAFDSIYYGNNKKEYSKNNIINVEVLT